MFSTAITGCSVWVDFDPLLFGILYKDAGDAVEFIN